MRHDLGVVVKPATVYRSSPEAIPVARRVTRISAPNFSAWCTIRLADVLPSTLFGRPG